MNFVIPGGSGQVGTILKRGLQEAGHAVVILSRKNSTWDGETLGPWCKEIDSADVVINLAGRSVNCRYSPENLRLMMDSRVSSARIVGEAISQSASPPKLWLQMSTATIYAHRFDDANDEAHGIIGGNEPDAPAYWRTSIEIAQAWERTLEEANTPDTRKVAMRTSMVMSPDAGGIFDVLSTLTKRGLGGPIGGGKQFISWIHEADLVRAFLFLVEHEEITGPVNICAPHPLTQSQFQRVLREALGVRIGLPATAWMAKLGAIAMRTDAELLLKSRRVVPGRLLEVGFAFQFPDWTSACQDLVKRQ